MPWSAGEASKFNKGLSESQKSKWSSVANSVLARTGDEGQAIRVANSRSRPHADAAKRRLRKRNVQGGTYG